MKVVFSKHFEARYPTNLVENPNSARSPCQALLEAGYEFAEPTCASMEDIPRVLGLQHIETVQSNGLYKAAALAAGGAICAAELALQGKSLFARVRPRGYRAAANLAWE